MKKLLAYSILLTLSLVLTAPYFLYIIGLSHVNGKPQPSTVLVTSKQQRDIWHHIEKTDEPPNIVNLNPWSYIVHILRNTQSDAAGSSYGVRPTYLVARDYILSNSNGKKPTHWHLTSSAMTIWVSRNWSKEEILSKLYTTYSYELSYNKFLHSEKSIATLPIFR